jgi:hypothetical protein
MAFIRVRTETSVLPSEGTIAYVDIETGAHIARRLPDGTILRIQGPPFLALSPCPYCGGRG